MRYCCQVFCMFWDVFWDVFDKKEIVVREVIVITGS